MRRYLGRRTSPQGQRSPDNPIVISSYGEGKRPVIDREDVKKDLIGIHLVEQEGVKIVGIEFNRCQTGIYAEYAVGSPNRKYLWIENCYFHDSLLYQPYQTYPKRKIGLGICLFSHETKNKIVASDITVKNCEFRRLASGIWTNSPDNFNKSKGNIVNFGNFVVADCLFEEGYQWHLGMRGVDGGACVAASRSTSTETSAPSMPSPARCSPAASTGSSRTASGAM